MASTMLATPMMEQAYWVVGRGTGITALVLFTLSIATGIVTRSGRPLLTLPRFAVMDVHRNTTLLAVAYLLIHIGTLLMDPYAQLRLVDTVVPFLGAYRPLWLGLGTLAFDLALAITVTSVLRHRFGLRTFRLVHWLPYLLWPLAFAHALGNGTETPHRWFLVIVGGCALTVVAALAVRVRADFVEFGGRRIAR